MDAIQSMPQFITYYALIGLVCAVAAYVLAAGKNRDAHSWAVLAFVLPPAVLLLLVLPRLSLEERQVRHIERRFKRHMSDD